MIFLEQRINDMYKYIEENNITLTLEERTILDICVKNKRKKKDIGFSLTNGLVKDLLTTFRIVKIEDRK